MKTNIQIFQLITVVLAAVAAGGALLLGMLYSYGPTGTYLAANVLLSPDVTTEMAFQDANRQARFYFDHVEFSYFDDETGEFRKKDIDQTQYRTFYEKVSSERSLANVDQEVIASFGKGRPATLIVYVRDKSTPGASPIAFQEVDFVSRGDYFRVELHQENAQNEWAYFYFPGIYREALTLFAKP